jgi:DNA-binding NarL/FixJ family response regulator
MVATVESRVLVGIGRITDLWSEDVFSGGCRVSVTLISWPGEMRVTLIGRATELAAVADLLDRGRAGRAGLSIVAGPGMGKSALLEAAADRARQAGCRVLRCRGVEAEATMAYAALTDLLTPVADELDAWLAPPLAHALRIVMLRADVDDEAVEPHAVARAVTEGLRALSRGAPVLLVLDDTHWLDPESVRTIGFAIRRVDDSSVAVLTARREETRARADAPDLEAGAAVHRLPPLKPDEIEQLLAERGHALPRAALRRVQRFAGGHPLYALELARAACEGDFDVPAPLLDLLRRRLAVLPEKGMPVAIAVALAAAPTRALVAAALDTTVAAVDPAVDAAVDAGILNERAGVLSFTHPLLAEAASAGAPSALRRRVHRSLAASVGDAEQRAVHLSAAHTEPDESVATALEAGARRARARAAPEVAAELLSAALRLTPETSVEARRRRRVEAAYCNVAAGRPAAGAALLQAAIADEPDGEGRADLEWRAGMLQFLAGDLSSCIPLLECARHRTKDEALRNELSTRLANMCCWAGDFDRGAAVAETVSVDSLTGPPRLRALATRCMTEFASGRALTVDPWQVVAEFEQLAQPPPPHEHPIAQLFAPLSLMGRPAELSAIAAGALARALDESDDVGIAWAGASAAHAELHTGRWPAAAAAADESVRAARRAGSVPALVIGIGAAAAVSAYRGDLGAAERLADELLAIGERQPFLSCVGHGHSVLGFIALSRGDAQKARAEYLLAARTLDRELPRQPGLPSLRWFVTDALIDAGDFGEAEARISRLEAPPENLLAAALAATGRGRIAAARGDRSTADEAFGRALAAHDRLMWPFERAVTLYYQGCALRDQQRRSLARAALASAGEVFRTLGAPAWLERVEAALAGISGRTPSAPDALTRMEAEVAGLAAAGLTNQQIAGRLFVSPKTVATHLSHVYAKLAVRSRTELAARMQRIS